MLIYGETRIRGLGAVDQQEINHGKPVVPSSQRGGRDLKQISPKASIVRSGRGGQSISDHPVCAFKGSFAIFFCFIALAMFALQFVLAARFKRIAP